MVVVGLVSLLVLVAVVPCTLSTHQFYFYPGYLGQPGRSPFLPHQGPLVLPYSGPLQPLQTVQARQADINTFATETMGNRSSIVSIIIEKPSL